MIQSPLNYTGGKYKLLPQILPLFPGDIRVFVDLFCGGCNVGLNVDCSQVIYNDRNENLFRLYRTFQKLDKERLLGWIYEIIESYGLSLVSRNGYAHYHCDSSKGLGSWNREGYLKLRRDFNQRHGAGERDDYYYVMLYVLIVYAFNNQIRFNADGEFNLPVGKRDFNGRMEQKLLAFLDRIREQDCCFTCCDFRELDTSAWTSRDFVYADPPYLITCATYNPDDVSDPRELNQTDLAVVTAHLGVAENGAVWITREVKYKALYFVSDALVVLLDRDSIVNNMHEAYQQTREMRYDFGAFIAGPSKTADIEQALVFGAHGPVEVLVVVR